MAETKSERLQIRITPNLKAAANDTEVWAYYGVKSAGELVCKLLEDATETVSANFQATPK